MHTDTPVVRALVALMAMSAAGCATGRDARYVYQDGQFGVVGIPKNTTTWPKNYRKQAELLMKQHFPAGYEVVRAEEVVEGSRTLVVGGTKTAEIAPELPSALLKVIKLGRSATTNQSDQLKITECRIIYKKSASDPSTPGYASAVAASPSLYLDPNAQVRREAEHPELFAAHKADEAKPAEVKADKAVLATAAAAPEAVVRHTVAKPVPDLATPPKP